jgi:hypothetical protein
MQAGKPGRRSRRCGGALLLALGAIFIAVAAAPAAEEVTRESYRQAVEPICKTNTEANERILGGVRAMVRHDKLAPAARRFSRAAAALRSTVKQLGRLPRPAADTARISRWLGLVGTEADLLDRTSRYLAVDRKAAALGMVVRLESVANRANNVVVPFEFDYCRFEPSRFT